MKPTRPRRHGGLKPAPAHAVAALLVVFFLLVMTAAADKSVTYDESVHIYSGWRILTQGDFATNHEHPPLMKALAAAPLVLTGAKPPKSVVQREADQWSVAHDFVYHANDGDRVLRSARLPIALLATLMAYVVHRYAAATLGPGAALVTLGLLVFEPNLLAHSGLVTTDLGITAMSFFTFVAFVRSLRAGSYRWSAGAGALFGLALLTKFTGVLLLPVLAAAGALMVMLDNVPGKWRRLAIGVAILTAVGLFVLNLGYGFGGTFSSLRSFAPESQSFRERAAGPWGGVPLPVPVEYVRGFDHAEAGGQRWWSYLFGQHSMTGWRHYYLAALAVKTPLPLLLLAAGGLLAALLGVAGVPGLKPPGPRTASSMSSIDALLPLVPVLGFLVAFTFSANLKNIGLRYILAIYPFLCLMGGVAFNRLPFKLPTRSVLAAVLVLWQAGAAVWIYPDFLTFFNLTVGGPSRGPEVLLDSNLDWGQDLKGLGRYIREDLKPKGVDKIYVDYFGRGCLNYYGVTSTPDFEGGYIAVSATHLKGVYSEQKDRYRFLWGREPEAVIGGSIFIYDAPCPPDWKPKPPVKAE